MRATDEVLLGDDVELRFGSDEEPGICRTGHRRPRHVDTRTGRPVDPATVDRIRRLAIPPAWTDVWISADPSSHLQATGRDARGRKQRRYHPAFTQRTSALKFAELPSFGAGLGRLRRRVRRDLATDGLGHDRVVAVVVRLMDLTSIRVGNELSAVEQRTYGLTTLRERHVSARGDHLHLAFAGKSHRRFEVDVADPVLAKVVRRCQQLPGQLLFRYRTTAGDLLPIRSDEVNAYLARHCAPGATAKTFRTWNATVKAAAGLAAVAGEGPPTARRLNAVIDDVARELGNTRAVCRQSYVHPVVVESYLDGSIAHRWQPPPARRIHDLAADELRTLRLLRSRR